MVIYSLLKNNSEMIKVQIEGSLVRGIPRVQVIGLADKVVKESVFRIKSSLLHQGFRWVIKRNLILSLKPSSLKKSDSGVDLALLVIFLRTTGQLQLDESKKYVFYGELSLDGKISEESLSERGVVPLDDEIWIGNFTDHEDYNENVVRIKKVSDFRRLHLQPKKKKRRVKKDISPYSKDITYLSREWLRVFEIICHGEHSTFFCIPESYGLNEFVSTLHKNLHNLSDQRKKGVRLVSTEKGYRRPYVKMDSSVTKREITGTSSSPSIIQSTHGGLVYLNNFLNFPRGIKDLFSSLNQKYLAGYEQDYRSVLIAQTPLCPCGKASLGKMRNCQYSLYRCRSTIEKLNIDELSLFHLVMPLQKSVLETSLFQYELYEEMNERRVRAFELQKRRGQVVSNAELRVHELSESLSLEIKQLELLPENLSYERMKALLSVARTMADLEGSEEIKIEHIEESKKWSLYPILEIRRLF